MNDKKTIGIILILAGIGLFIISFAFVKGYDKRDGLLGSLGRMEFVLRESREIPKPEPTRPAPALAPLSAPESPRPAPTAETHRIVEDFQPVEEVKENATERPTVVLPFKYFFAIDIAIIFVGIGFLILPKQRSAR